MSVFLQILSANAQYIYGLCLLGALFLLRRALRARRERRGSMFALEREVALYRLGRVFGGALVLLLIMAATWALSNLVLPRIQESVILPTPTPDLLVLIDTPTPTQPPPTATPTSTPTPRPRPTAIPTLAAATPTPSFRPPACPHPGAIITGPGVGQTVTSEIAITGVAQVEAFQFYKLEWAAAVNPGQWNWFAGSETPVSGVLGVFNPGGLPSGSYTVRLVVVDATGNYPPPCTVELRIP